MTQDEDRDQTRFHLSRPALGRDPRSNAQVRPRRRKSTRTAISSNARSAIFTIATSQEVLVEGEDGYKAAKSFMKLLMPSHAQPGPAICRRHAAVSSAIKVEDQLGAMYQPVVQLKSGGYLVINPTEALVSIDINSGRSTREHNIEQTALKTNIEAAREIARQLRLRDMAGLVVIDFIDMDHRSNNRKVENALKEALKTIARAFRSAAYRPLACSK